MGGGFFISTFSALCAFQDHDWVAQLSGDLSLDIFFNDLGISGPSSSANPLQHLSKLVKLVVLKWVWTFEYLQVLSILWY